MKAAEAISAAREWVRQYASQIPGYAGAYISGSTLELQPEDEFPETSDVDIVLVTAQNPEKIGKLRYCGVLLEPSCIAKSAFAQDSVVQSTHYLAWGLHADSVLDDPEGWLKPLSRRITAGYWRRENLLRRVANVSALAERHISGMSLAQTPEDRLMACAFGPGCLAFPILAAAGRNCTVRRRLPAARAVLTEFGMPEYIAELEAALGCRNLSRKALLPHMDALEETFDIAAGTSGPSAAYPFRADIRPEAKAAAVGGCRSLLTEEHPSDAVFWMMATFARCQIVLRMDDSELYARRLPALTAFAQLLGVDAQEKAFQRQAQVREILCRIRMAAQAIAEKCGRETA